MVPQEVSLLFVEDDITVQNAMLGFLEMLPFSDIYVASNGEDGLKQFHLHKPDIVLTDLRMPIMNGLEMSQEIKSLSPDTPIVLITAQFEKEITEEAVDIGIDAYLFKPISLERLDKILAKYKKIILKNRSYQNQHKLLEEYKSAIDASAAVTKTDVKGVLTYVNDSFCIMTGYKREELLGKRHNIIKHPDTPQALYVDLWRTITRKKVWKGRIQNLKKDGTPYNEYSVIVPIINEKNTIVEFIAIRQDITDMYRQEVYLKKRVEEEVSKNLLETKYGVIGRMAAGITHEINTPLTYIKGNVELMLNDINEMDDSIKQKDYLLDDMRVIIDGTNRIGNIIESMREMFSSSKEAPKAGNVYSSLITALTLSYSKAKQITKIQIQNQPFVIGMKGEKFHYDAMIQKNRIEQVWVIIINNAADALKNLDSYDQRLLEISIASEYEYIVVRFKDNGGGIDESILSKIFDPFESTKEDGGMGIGLNVAKRIVDDHNGKIVAANYEDGALFEVYLPKC